jgi:predicted transcriptional regulator
MKKGAGVVQKGINELLRKKARTTKELADALNASRQYIRKTLRNLVDAGKVIKTGVASPKGGCTYKRKR